MMEEPNNNNDDDICYEYNPPCKKYLNNNNNILQRLKQNDPTITDLSITLNNDNFGSFKYMNWKEDGDCIANNTQLKTLNIYSYNNLPTREQLLNFFSCIHRNNSINELVLHSFENLEVLQHTTNLEHLQLKKYELVDEKIQMLSDALVGNISTLKSLSLESHGANHITSTGWQKLSVVLQSSTCKLAKLSLQASMNNDGVDALGSALRGSSVKVLDLSCNPSITNWQTLLNQLGQFSLSLDSLNLSGNNVDDAILATLSAFTLKSINLCRVHCTTSGWQSFFNTLQRQRIWLRELSLTYNHIGNGGITALASLLKSASRTLKLLEMYNVSYVYVRTGNSININGITSQDWLTFFNALQGVNLDLAKLNLGNNSINDDGLQLLARLLSNMSSLKYLGLRRMRLLTPTGWQFLTGYLQSPNFALKELDLGDNNINDDTLIPLISALVHNKTMKRLSIEQYDEDNTVEYFSLFTERGWDAISNLLCNKTSIMDTYNSHHTLQSLGHHDSIDLPGDLLSYLKLNENKDKAEVARQKILQTHFSTDDDYYDSDMEDSDDDDGGMEEFLDIKLEVMPAAIEWIGRTIPVGWIGTNVSGLSTMYNLVRGLPDLFDPSAQKKKVAAAAREE